jgi:putative alpha-1,2-mannosidase
MAATAPSAAAEIPYVQRLWLDGRRYERSWLWLETISGGAALDFELGPRPTAWGTRHRPPSFSPRHPLARGR